jgi:predicted enzyme related to lactoylglutathione lyase
MGRFFTVKLRTSDVDAARAFYAAVLGERALDVVKLHEQAVARGARPHWLGYVDAANVEHALAAFTERGATALGPKWVDPEGLEAAVVRDPGGAILALAKRPPSVPTGGGKGGGAGPDVGWYQLNTTDVERAKANYRALFGWDAAAPLDLGPRGLFHPFAWEPGAPAVGWMSDIATRAGVHAHWLFHFRVAAIGPAIDAVRSFGGSVVDAATPPGGARIAVCDDPQGAAFAIREEQGEPPPDRRA